MYLLGNCEVFNWPIVNLFPPKHKTRTLHEHKAKTPMENVQVTEAAAVQVLQ